MFLTKTTTTIRGKTYTHFKVVESFREAGHVKHRVLFSLGSLNDEQAQRVRAALAAGRGEDWVHARFEDIVVTNHAAYLDVAVGHQLWQAGGWPEFWGSHGFWVEALVLNRLIEPQAKIHLQSWVTETAIPAYYGVTPATLDPFAVYRILDQMAARETEVHEWLAAHLPTTDLGPAPTFFYDLTSTYVDGTTCPLAKPGYSREHRPDRTQIVIGLVITHTGYPVYWQVWPGNTPDVSTVQSVVADLQVRLGLGPCTLVFDRGMVSAANLAALDEAGHTYLSTVDRDELTQLTFWSSAWPEAVPTASWRDAVHARGMQPSDETDELWFREFRDEGRRWVMAFDHRRFELEMAVQAAALTLVQQWVKKKNAELAAARRARPAAPIDRALQDLLRRKHLQSIQGYRLQPKSVTLSTARGNRTVSTWEIVLTLNDAARRAAQRLFGVTCFQTNGTEDHLSGAAIITWYRRKNRVEEAFPEIKSPLALRPLYVSRPERIRAHVMVCMLAYALYNTMEERLRRHHRAESPATVFHALRSGQINRLQVKTTQQTHVTATTPSPAQVAYVDAVECDTVLTDRTLKPILHAMESWL